ncbi:MAG: DUF2784 domain-containing protein [Xanthomonadales bacterium]|nr:DUF2784 domain-containing protein [Xanthomonadales bacterium]
MNLFRLLADAVLTVHAAVVLFVVGGVILIVAGNVRGWGWVNRGGFRLAHVLAIAIVVVQSWFGIECPLTTLENWLRIRAGDTAYTRSFIEDWLHRLLFFDAPTWVFAVVYTLFGALVVAVWWRYPPRRSPVTHARRKPAPPG